ncbi:hypothetical protein PPSC2_28025 (plasmid) [Paenibacillus polymyxa SC2]|uniref:Uncharacterized protein n=1 Tax=Paenibacillus polymyxa (strain SC2) TaxID=886882 RepID=E3EJN5_PAEPS|nr:hypothetical protein PPSC2_28025 [Paenibacillus polymyxa SC2]
MFILSEKEHQLYQTMVFHGWAMLGRTQMPALQVHEADTKVLEGLYLKLDEFIRTSFESVNVDQKTSMRSMVIIDEFHMVELCRIHSIIKNEVETRKQNSNYNN